jgi:hypothetical protein
MAGLPKYLIKKYGVSKKAWAVFRGNKTTTRTTKTKSRGASMKRKSGKRSSSGFGGGKLMTGFYKPSGMIQSALIGIGTAAVANKLPINVPYKAVIAAGVTGGLPGAAAVYFMQTMGGSSPATDSNSDLVSPY